MPENGAHFSGQGHLIEAVILGDVNKTVIPVVCDAQGRLIIDLSSAVITIGVVDQGMGGTSPWLVHVDNFPAVQAVSGTFWQAIQPVSGTVTALQGTNPWTVDGTVSISGTVPISGTVTANLGTVDGLALDATLTNGTQHTLVDNFPATQPVSGTVTALQGTSPWVVSGSISTSPNVNVHDGSGNTIASTGTSLNVDVTNTVPVTGTFFQAIQPVSGTVAVSNFPATQNVNITGNTTDFATQTTLAEIEEDLDQFTFAATRLLIDGSGVTQPVSGTVGATQSGEWDVNIEDTAGNALTSTAGALDVNIKSTGVTQPISGTVTALQGTSPWVVSGTVTTSPNVNVHDGAGNTIASTGTSLNVDVTNTIPVTGTFFQAIQPVSGTVTANQGTSPWVTSLASTTITGNVTVVQPTGSNLNVAVSNFPATVAVTQSTSPWVVSGTVTTSPNVNVHDGSGNTIASTGTSLNVDVTNTVPVTLASTTITGNVTVVQPTGTNLHVVVDSAPSTVVTQGTSPWVISGAVTNTPPANQSINLAQENGVSLGSPSAYGTSPGAVIVPGVNAFITNTPAVTLASTTITGNVTVTQATGTNLHTVVDNFPVDTDAVAQASTTAGQLGSLNMGAVTTAAPTYVTAQTDPLSLDTAGNLRVLTGAGSTTVVTGNVTVVQPTGTNLHVVNDASSAVIGHVITDTGSTTAVTGNVTVVQPTGTNLHTVVDNFPADTDAVAIGSTTAGQLGSLSMGAVTTAAPTYTTAQTDPLSLTTTGLLRVDGSNVTQPISQVSTLVVAGNKTNNAAAPVADNIGVLPALANAANPTWTEGDQVLESVDLSGRQRIRDAYVTTATVTRVSVGPGSAVTLLASRGARIRVVIYNEAGVLFIKAGSTASVTDYTWSIGINTELEIEGYYTGILTAIKGSATTNVQVTDF